VQEGVTRGHFDRASSERLVPVRRELGITTFGVNLMALNPGQRNRIHLHREQEEAYLVLEGTLTVLVEGEEYELAPFDAIRVAPSLRRQLVNRSSERVLFLALGGSAEHVGRDADAFASWDDPGGRPPADVPLPPDLNL
jgi:uncharacterized cupin superfamily protein